MAASAVAKYELEHDRRDRHATLGVLLMASLKCLVLQHAVSHLVQGSWPLLRVLCLSAQGLEDKACSLLGIGAVVAETHSPDVSDAQKRDVNSSRCAVMYKSHLPQFASLTVQICKH